MPTIIKWNLLGTWCITHWVLSLCVVLVGGYILSRFTGEERVRLLGILVFLLLPITFIIVLVS